MLHFKCAIMCYPTCQERWCKCCCTCFSQILHLIWLSARIRMTQWRCSCPLRKHERMVPLPNSDSGYQASSLVHIVLLLGRKSAWAWADRGRLLGWFWLDDMEESRKQAAAFEWWNSFQKCLFKNHLKDLRTSVVGKHFRFVGSVGVLSSPNHFRLVSFCFPFFLGAANGETLKLPKRRQAPKIWSSEMVPHWRWGPSLAFFQIAPMGRIYFVKEAIFCMFTETGRFLFMLCSRFECPTFGSVSSIQ